MNELKPVAYQVRAEQWGAELAYPQAAEQMKSRLEKALCRQVITEPLVTLSSAQSALDAANARVVELEARLKDRESMHRRAQIAEGAVAAVVALVDFWAPKRDGLPRESAYIRTMQRDIEKALAKARELPSTAEARAAKAEKLLEEAHEVLSGISSFLGAGLGDDDTTPEQFDKRIRWGIDEMQSGLIRMLSSRVEEASKKPGTTWGEVKALILSADPAARTLCEKMKEARG